MACPVCDHTMQKISDGPRVFWCPRCGSLRTLRGENVDDETPSLVWRAKSIADTIVRMHAKCTGDYAGRARLLLRGDIHKLAQEMISSGFLESVGRSAGGIRENQREHERMVSGG